MGEKPPFAFLLPPHDSGRQRLVCISGCSLGASAGSSPAHAAPARQEQQQQQPAPSAGARSCLPQPLHVQPMRWARSDPPGHRNGGHSSPLPPKRGGVCCTPSPMARLVEGSTHGPRPLSEAFCSRRAPQMAPFLHPQLPSCKMSSAAGRPPPCTPHSAPDDRGQLSPLLLINCTGQELAAVPGGSQHASAHAGGRGRGGCAMLQPHQPHLRWKGRDGGLLVSARCWEELPVLGRAGTRG